MMKKSIKKSCALLIACALTLSAFAVLPKANAANMVDTGKKDCSIDFKTGGDDKVSADLGTTTVDVKLYKVADISEVGDYTASGDFAQLDVSALDASDSTSADEWLKRATEAAGMVTDSTKPTAEVSLTDGEGKAEDLATGLYLVLADKAQTTNYEYTFTPYLISLPNNYYYQTGDDGMGIRIVRSSSQAGTDTEIWFSGDRQDVERFQCHIRCSGNICFPD